MAKKKSMDRPKRESPQQKERERARKREEKEKEEKERQERWLEENHPDVKHEVGKFYRFAGRSSRPMYKKKSPEGGLGWDIDAWDDVDVSEGRGFGGSEVWGSEEDLSLEVCDCGGR